MCKQKKKNNENYVKFSSARFTYPQTHSMSNVNGLTLKHKSTT